jgi:hypothetical protein
VCCKWADTDQEESAVILLADWSNFYVIVGSSAGALTGLTFVMISLVIRQQPEDARLAINAFSTPIVVHFSAVLLVAALLSAPWTALAPVAVLLGVGSVGGLGYVVLVMWRVHLVRSYEPEWDDWLWYGVLPAIAYGALLVSAILLPSHPTPVLFVDATALVLLLAIGIRDAWDIVTYLAILQMSQSDTERDHQAPGAPGR